MLSLKESETPRSQSMEDEEGQTFAVEEVEVAHALRKQSKREILMLAYSSLGAIYGDIGTSPLYVLDSIKYPNKVPTQEDIYGAVSLIFYLFLLLVLIKYALIVLTYGPNEGEGGQVAIYAKIARCLKFGPKGVIIPGTPEKSDTELLQRTDTTSSFLSTKSSSNWKQNPTVVKFISMLTLFGCFLGCSLVMSDGLLTPTTSVLSAVAGIQVAKPSFTNVLAVAEVIIVVLFLIQQLGSHRIAHAFAPIVLLWLVGLVACGVINITHHPAIFKSLSPYYAIKLLKNSGVDALGGAMLAITGCEAMFADLGHFGKLPCQMGITLVFVCLIITYLGQGAFLVKHPDALASVFYQSIPGGVNGWFYWVMFVLAILSTIIASQALILGVFSILSQLINLDCFPKFRVKHVSASYAGKVYVPAANLLLLIGVVGTTAGFKNSNNVTAAYGLGISLDFLVTSTLMIICMVYVYEFKVYVPILFCLIFVPLEVCLIIANLKKVPHGGWFPLMMCGFFFSFFAFWRYCRDRTVAEQLRARVRLVDIFPDLKKKPPTEVVDLRGRSHTREASDLEIYTSRGRSAHDQEELLSSNAHLFEKIASKYGDVKLELNPGVAIIYSDTPRQDLASPNSVPGVYAKLVTNFASMPSIVIFSTIRVLSIPTVATEEKIKVGTTKIPGHYKCIIRFGFMEEVVIDTILGRRILEEFVDVTGMSMRAIAQLPVLHVFENNKIRSHEYLEEEYATKNPLKLAQRFARKFMIDQVFSPINSIFQFNELYVKITDEEREGREKLNVGGIMRI